MPGLTLVNIGTTANDGTGDPLRTAFQNVNSSLTYLDGKVGAGTVSSVSVTSNNGITSSVADPSTTPSITLGLGAITPTSVNGITLSGSSTPSVSVTGSSTLSGTNTGDQSLFSTIAVAGQSSVVADSTSDTLTLVAGSNVTITTDATTDTITISSTGGGGGGGAPTSAEYLVKTADATLTAERVVGDSTSITANWVTAGNVTFERAALTGDVTASANSNATTIAAQAVTYSKIQNISATSRILGRKTAAAGSTEECTLSDVLDFVGSAAQGDILYRGASGWTRLGAGTSGYYLKTQGAAADPVWAAVSGGSGGGSSNVWIPAAQMIPRTTNGAGINTIESSATNKINYDVLEFDSVNAEYAQAIVVMPSNYNNGTVTARFYWTATVNTGTPTVTWGIKARAYGDNVIIDNALGSGVTVQDTVTTANYMLVSSSTAAVTIDGTPASNKAVIFEFYRDPSVDDLAVDARLLGVEISYTAA